MIQKALFMILVSLMIACVSVKSESAMGKGAMGININYPGVGVKYGLSDKTAAELKLQTGDNINIVGLRYYKYISPESFTSLFWGAEGDYVSFKGSGSEGTGYAGGVFLGGESFILSNLGIMLDVGAMYIGLADNTTKESVAGFEPVINIGINIYLGGGR